MRTFRCISDLMVGFVDIRPSWKQPQHLTWTFFLLSVAGCLYSPIRNMCGKKHVCRTILFLQNDSVLLRGELFDDKAMALPRHHGDRL